MANDEIVHMSLFGSLGSGGGAAARAAALLLVVFVAGGFAGSALDRVYLGHRGRLIASGADESGLGRHRFAEPSDPLMRRAESTGIPAQFFELDLTPDQEARLAEIAHRQRPRSDSVMRALRPVARRLETEMMQEMLCTLTPPQQAKWLAMMQERKFDPDVVAERYRPVRTHTCP